MSVNKLKYFFAVDTKYVIKKLMLLMFPYTHQVTKGIVAFSGQVVITCITLDYLYSCDVTLGSFQNKFYNVFNKFDLGEF